MKISYAKPISLEKLAVHLLRITYIDFPMLLAKYSLSSALGILSLVVCWLFLVPMTLMSAVYFLWLGVIWISRRSFSRLSKSSQDGSGTLNVVPTSEQCEHRKAE